MDEKLVSIILTSYNADKYLNNILTCIKNQTYSAFELIIIDDSSTDKSLSLLEDFVAKNNHLSIVLIKNLKNVGQAASINIGLDKAKHKYVCLLDSDDKIAPNFIASLLQKIRLGFQFAYCGFNMIDTINNKVIPFERNRQYIFESEKIISTYMSAKNHFSFVGAIYDRDFLVKHELRFNESNRYGCDIEFICDLFLKKPKCSCIPESLYFYIIRPNSLSTNTDCPHIFHCVEGLERIQRKIPNLYGRFKFSITRKGNMIFHVLSELSIKKVQKKVTTRKKLYYASHFLLQLIINKKSKMNKANFKSLGSFLKS